jgi:hypothetical protein
VKKEGDDASPPSSSALGRSGGEEERGAVVVGSFKMTYNNLTISREREKGRRRQQTPWQQ